MDLAKLKEEMMSDAKTDLTGVDLTQIHVGVWDITDFDALTDFEKFIKTGRRVYHITTIDVPHLVVLSSPKRQG